LRFEGCGSAEEEFLGVTLNRGEVNYK